MKETPMQEEFDMEKELQQEFIQELAEFFKIFGDATRIRILQTLLEGERNVGDLADVLEGICDRCQTERCLSRYRYQAGNLAETL